MSQTTSIRRRFEMPLLLLCGLGLSAFFTAIGTVTITLMAVIAPFSSSYTVDGQPASRAEFMRFSWPLFLIFPPFLALFGSIAYALWRERPWSRPLMLVFWTAMVVTGVGMALSPLGKEEGAWPSAFSYVVILLVAWWYLYRKRGVVEYYRLLSMQTDNGTGGMRKETVLEHRA